jgi:4'-phosphopantetheinyl transferase
VSSLIFVAVYWLEQTEADVPVRRPESGCENWLSPGESIHLGRLRFPKRHADWRLGRWTAKRAVAQYLRMPKHDEALANLEIRAAPDGAPEVFQAGQPAPVVISLSHRAGLAACTVASAGTRLGCDLELVEPRSDAFAADYFTYDEQALLAQAPSADRSRLLALLWSAKESALKALRTGLRMDTRCLAVTLGDANGVWRPLQVRAESGRAFHGWWQTTGSVVRTLIVDPPGLPPDDAVFKTPPPGRLG